MHVPVAACSSELSIVIMFMQISFNTGLDCMICACFMHKKVYMSVTVMGLVRISWGCMALRGCQANAVELFQPAVFSKSTMIKKGVTV